MRLKYGLLAVLFITLLSCFIPLGAANERVILKIFELPDPRKTDAYTKANLAVIDAFRKKHPEIELRAYSGIKIENMDLDAGPLMAIAGGVAPDIIYVNFRQSDTYIQNNFLYPLDEFLRKQNQAEVQLRVEKPVWQVIKRKKKGESDAEMRTHKGKGYQDERTHKGNGYQDERTHKGYGYQGNGEQVWALPYETLVRVLMYRKDAFRRVGLDAERPPRTWAEYFEYARRLTNPADGSYGSMLAGGPQAAYDWIQFLWAAGGDAVRYNPKTEEWYASFGDEAGVKAMEFYLKLAATKWKDAEGKPQTGFVEREGEWGYMWQEGKIAMRMDYLSQQNMGGAYDPNLYGFAPSPAGPSGHGGSEINCRMMGIFSGAGESNNSGLGKRDPKVVKQAAWDYIWFYDSEEARQIRMKIMIDSGYGRMQNPVFLQRYGYSDYLKYAPAGWLETFENALEYGKPEPFGNNCQKVYEYMTYPLQELLALDLAGKLGTNEAERRARIQAVLKKGVQRTNEQMIGKLPDNVRAFRERLAMLIAIIIMLAFAFTIWRVWKILTPTYKIQQKNNMQYRLWVILLLAPAVLTILVWKYMPMFTGSLMAFKDFHIVGPSPWIGFGNFAEVLFDGTWWSSVGKTLYYMALSLTLGFVPPIILAILLQEVSRAKMVYRVIYYLPAVISGVIVIYLWKLLYEPGDTGGFNQILMSMGLPKSMWIKDEKLAMLCVILPTIWAGMGPGCLIYLAALKNIPNELYEAADIDGAGFLRKIRFIVFPYLKTLVIIQFIAAFIVAAQSSDFILVMTFGGPNEATRVADLLIFEKAYLYLRFGLATTMAWMLSLLLMGFTVMQIKYLSKMEFRTAKRDDE